MNEEEIQTLKVEAKSAAVHYWYVLVIILMGVALIITWNSRENQRKEKEVFKARVQTEGTIKEIEARLVAMQQREEEYKKIYVEQDKLKATLAALEKQRKELDKKKKETLRNEIEKMGLLDVSRAFNSMGITNTITSSK
jgi:succinate dehydrogenase/fumarate reductase flavoprotein subunit